MFGCSVFTIGSATAKDIQTLVITRFFAGVFGASPLCVVPGVLTDVYHDMSRGTAISIYALAVFVGPLAAPFIGGFITTSYLRWRWTLYLPAILGFFGVVLLLFFTRETYAPIVLSKKAGELRRQTGNWCIHAEHERVEFKVQELAHKYFIRPVTMLVTEPAVLLVSLYMSFVYGLVYALLGSYPYVFQSVHGMSAGVSGLPFIALVIGVMLGDCFVVWQQRRSYHNAVGVGSVPAPEARLLPAVIGAPTFTIGLFWCV
jgi:DHA1 family multidrug resistance protein-like MFS transporter